jgi:hypothetical protein
MNTKRVGAVVARSAASHAIVAHPVLMQLCDALLGAQVLRMDRTALAAHTKLQQLPWGLELAQLIQVGPESDPQPLHYGVQP